MADKTCPQCQKPFPVLIMGGRKKKYCSETCRLEARNDRRRLKEGHVPRAVGPSNMKKRQAARPPDSQSPGDWADAVRATHDLDAAGQEILSLAIDALRISRGGEEARDRLAAMGRFQALVRQLGVGVAQEKPQPQQQKEEARPTPVRPMTSADPRKILRIAE